MKIIDIGVQTAFFTPGLVFSDKLSLSAQLIKETGNIFDGDPIMLPIPPDAPPEFPRMILKSKDEKYVLEIKSSRIDFVVKSDQKDKSQKNYPATLIKDYQDKLQFLSSSIISIFKAKIVRIGLILNIQFKVNDAVAVIKKSYVNDSKFTKEAYDLNIGFLNKETLNGIDANIWFRANALRLPEKDKDNKILLVMFDANTVPEKVLDLSDQNITDFTETTIKYLDKNLKSYLPEYDDHIDA